MVEGYSVGDAVWLSSEVVKSSRLCASVCDAPDWLPVVGHEGEGCTLFPSGLERDWDCVPKDMPRENVRFWFVALDGSVGDRVFRGNEEDIAMWWCGNCYLKREDAVAAALRWWAIHSGQDPWACNGVASLPKE